MNKREMKRAKKNFLKKEDTEGNGKNGKNVVCLKLD